MMYFIGVTHINLSDNRWFYKGGPAWDDGDGPERRDGYIGLFDRNTREYSWYQILRKALTRYGYIVESAAPPTPYWEHLILPHTEE